MERKKFFYDQKKKNFALKLMFIQSIEVKLKANQSSTSVKCRWIQFPNLSFASYGHLCRISCENKNSS